MRPAQETRTVLSSNLESASFGISTANEAAIMGMLRDGIYTDKTLAVLREYSSNAWDSHKMAGKGDVPIQVTMPTYSTPTLKIRDFGSGLSHTDVFEVYCKYGDSTKRNTNDAVGMLGVGSKAGFSYSDTFTVVSYHGGMKRTYVAVLDESEKGQISLFDETPSDETGVEISIAVKPEDIRDFTQKAEQLYRHFIPRPEINIPLPKAPDEQTILKNGTITTQGYYGAEWIAIMGCVPYKVTLTQLDLTKVSRCLPNLSGSLFFDIGEVQIATSREELKYSNATKAKVIAKFNDLVDEYVLHALEDLEQPGVSAWAKRLKVQVLAKLDLPLPEEYKELAFMHAKIDYAPGTFVLLHNKSVTTRITVTGHTRLLIDDSGKTLDGYYLGADDYVVRGEGRTADEVRVLLDAALLESGLLGVEVLLLSSINWNAPYKKAKKIVNPKHKARMFVLDGHRSAFSGTYSNYWSTVTRVADPADVYVAISGFQGYRGFFNDYKEDRRLASHFGVAMPTVYGYKTSDKKPATGMLGVEYRTWREAFITSLLTTDNVKKIADQFWYKPGLTHGGYPHGTELAKVVTALGDRHVISQLLTRQDAATCENNLFDLAYRAGIKFEDSEAGKAAAIILESYPLLREENFGNLWKSGYNEPKYWWEYVQMVDERDARNAMLIDQHQQQA